MSPKNRGSVAVFPTRYKMIKNRYDALEFKEKKS